MCASLRSKFTKLSKMLSKRVTLLLRPPPTLPTVGLAARFLFLRVMRAGVISQSSWDFTCPTLLTVVESFQSGRFLRRLKPAVSPPLLRKEKRLMPRRRSIGRPRWIESARYAGRCKECRTETAAGVKILYFPGGTINCEPCGTKFKRAEAEARRRARTAAADAWDARQVYEGSDGALTRRFLLDLEKRGPAGCVAALLFRAQKSSRRAKMYGMTSYRGLAYDRKGESLKELTAALAEHGAALGITFGWGRDERSFNPWVLYVELSELGQVSFHSPERYDGPDYPGEWDGRRASEERIINFCQEVLGA